MKAGLADWSPEHREDWRMLVSVSGVGRPANILLCCSEHLVYEQDKLGNKQQIESPLPALTGARGQVQTGNNKENI